MTREVPDIEASLQLCKDMDSPSIVIPVSVIEKHFAAEPHPSYPDVPCYDMGELMAWAKEKGWTVTLATTGTMTDKRIVPGIRFSPVPDITQSPFSNQPLKESTKEENWQNKIVIYIAVGVIIVILGAFSLYLIKKLFGIPL